MGLDFDGSWEDIVQFSKFLEPGHFIRYIDRLGEEYEVINA
jgi:hypothetical protein